MSEHDPEIEELRAKVHCAVVLERTPPPWKLDRKESTKLSLKYRRGKGEILIVSHGGRGWWDRTSDARGDVFGLVQNLEPGLNFGHVRKRLRELVGLSPRFPAADRAGGDPLRTSLSPNAGRNDRSYGRTRQPGAISPASVDCPRASFKPHRVRMSCGKAHRGARGSRTGMTRELWRTSISADPLTKAR